MVSAGYQPRTVSTHSRPKAAGPESHAHNLISCRFNTQPPEGGWAKIIEAQNEQSRFNTQPPEGGWSHYPAGR